MTPDRQAGTTSAGRGGLSFGREDQSECARLRAALILLGSGYLFLTLCDYREGISILALRYLL